MNILLSYSKAHYDPNLKPEEHKYWGSSASILARTLYKLLSKMGTVTYIDHQEHASVAGQEFDLFVGVFANFAQIVRSCKIKRSIFFAVNMHPAERNQILLSFIAKNRLSPKALSGWDLLNTREISQGLKLADHILCVGNTATYNSYIKHGVPAHKIKVLNYGLDEVDTPKKPSTEKGTRRLLYVSSDIGLRKGFDIVSYLASDPGLQDQDFHLDIVGTSGNPYYQNKLAVLQKKLGNKVSYHGWLDSANQTYKDIMAESDVLLFPALEEGQAGTVLDAINHGVVPLLTANTGVDFSPFGFLDATLHSNRNHELLQKALSCSLEELSELKQKTLDYYQEYHASWVENLENSLDDCLTGFTYPKITVVLAIFNKESTIISLLHFLDRACKAYKHVEVQVIFDGCKDKSEQLTKAFFKKHPGYEVVYDVTPNIFEIKTNNLGLKRGTGKYGIIIQDDNYLYSPSVFHEGVTFLEKNPTAVILGGLAGVNYYPLGYSKNLPGPGQIADTSTECYWRQDAATNPDLNNRFFQVDACMRGPLFFRKSFLEKHGYLDEIYAPLYNDDMDIALRAKSKGFKVYAALMDVENKSFTMAAYDAKRWEYFSAIMERNAKLFYERWSPGTDKDYTWIQRLPMMYSRGILPKKVRQQLAFAGPTYRKYRGFAAKLPGKVINKLTRR